MRVLWRHTPSYSLAAAVCLSAVACATSQIARPHDDVSVPRGASLQVTNSAADDLQVFLVRSGTAVSIGAVPAQSTRVFLLNRAQLGDGSELSLLAKPRSGFYEQRSAVFAASAGRRIAWLVAERHPSKVVIVR